MKAGRPSRTRYEATIRDDYRGRSDAEREQDDSWSELSARELSAVIALDTRRR